MIILMDTHSVQMQHMEKRNQNLPYFWQVINLINSILVNSIHHKEITGRRKICSEKIHWVATTFYAAFLSHPFSY